MIITCVGDCGVDYFIKKDLLKPGGITLNFAVHASQAFPKKDKIQVISAIGSDKAAKRVVDVVNKYSLVPYITTLDGKTPIQYIDHDKNGEKQFVKYDEGILGSFALGIKEKEIVEKSDIVITVIYEQIEKLFDSVITLQPKKKMAVDFMDLSDYNKKTDIVKKYINNLDIAFFGLNSDEEKLLEKLKRLAEKYSKLFVITLGGDGSMVYYKKRQYFAKALRVKKVIDTTGAGDAFAATFLKNYLYTKDVENSLVKGNKKAAEIVQRLGTF